MYNEQKKTRWMAEYLAVNACSRGRISSVFSASEQYEKDLNKDICDFTKEEIVHFFICMEAKSKESLSVTNTFLKNYRRWCDEHGYSSHDVNYFEHLTIEDFKHYISKDVLEHKFISKETLESYIEQLLNPCDQLLLSLLYHGVKGKKLKEIIDLNVNQIQGNEVHLSTGRVLSLPEEVIELIRKTNNTYEYYPFSETNTEPIELVGDKVFKDGLNASTENQDYIYHRFSVKMSKFKKEFDNPELSINRIWKSGMLHALLEGARKNQMSFEEYSVSADAKPILERYEFHATPSKIAKQYKEYIEYIC